MQNSLIQKFFSFFRSRTPLGKANGKGNLIDNLSKTIQTDLLCLSKAQQENILSRVGISLTDLQSTEFQAKSFSDIWSIELLIIENLKFSALVTRLWLVRQKFRTQVGDEIYNRYLSTLPNDRTDEKLKEILNKTFEPQEQISEDQKNSIAAANEKLEEAIRSDIINLTRQIQRLSYYKFLRLDSIYKVKRRVLTVFCLVLLSMILVTFCIYKGQSCFGVQPQYYSLAIFTIFSGMIGSCMSLLQRTEKSTNAPTNFTDSVFDATDVDLSMSILYVWSLVLSGAIFSSILFLLAVSDFLHLGELFPKLSLNISDPNKPNYCPKSDDISALFRCITIENKNALMLVWAFMAGFAERLVPDTLDSLMERARTPKN